MIYVIGYYGHQNVGDEQFRDSIAYILDRQSPGEPVSFVDCDHIDGMAFPADAKIVLGGGDVMNTYFLDQIYEVFAGTTHEITALSVGVPFVSIYKAPSFRRINRIFVRTFQDTARPSFLRASQTWRVVVDASIFLLDIPKPERVSRYVTHLKGRLEHAGRPVLMVSLNATAIYRAPMLFGELMLLLLRVSETYHFCFVPYSTEPDYDDRVAAREAASLLPDAHVTVVEEALDAWDIMSLMQLSRQHLSMKFHSGLFSLYTGLPFVAVSSERKVANLCKDIGYVGQYYTEATIGTAPLDLLKNVVPIAGDVLPKMRAHAHEMYGIARNK